MIFNNTFYRTFNATQPYAEYTFNTDSKVTGVNIYGFLSVPDAFLTDKAQLTTFNYVDSPALSSIGDQAFKGCSALVMSVFPATVTSIGANSFYQATKVAFTQLNNLITVLPSSCFWGATALALTSLPTGLVTIGYNCMANTAVTISSIPASVTSMGSTCFGGCTKIQNIEIGASKVGTGVNQFSGCTGIKKVWIRSTCTEITAPSADLAPFANCGTTLEIYLESSAAPAGFGAYWNRTGAAGGTIASVVYNQATKPWA